MSASLGRREYFRAVSSISPRSDESGTIAIPKKYFVEIPDEYIGKPIAIIADVILEQGGAGYTEFVGGDQPEPDKKCLFIDGHACGTGAGDRSVKIPGPGRGSGLD